MQLKMTFVLCALGFGAIFFVGTTEEAAAAVPSSTPCSQRYNLVWQIPFTDSDVGKSLGTVLKRSEFSAARIKSLSRMSIGKAPDGTVALQMNIKKGENKSNTFFLDPLGGKGVERACLSLRVYLQNGFDWPLNGGTKMGWGLWGGDPTRLAGGTSPKKQAGVSLRNVNGQKGFRLYSYNLNRNSEHGQYGPNGARWKTKQWGPGRWHKIEVEMVMNSLGKADGFAQLWLDGKDRRTMKGLEYRTRNKNWLIRGLMVNDMWGGNTANKKHWSLKEQKMWYADYKLYTMGSGSSKVVSSNTNQPNTNQPNTNQPNTNTLQGFLAQLFGAQSNTAQASSSSFGPIAPDGKVSRSNVSLQWSPDAGASKYYLKVVKKANRATVFAGSAATSRCSDQRCSLNIGSLARGQYEWMVRPVYGKTNGDYQGLTFVAS